MFGRKKKSDLRRTVVGENGTIEGTLCTADDVLIAGTIRGSVDSQGHVLVGPTGHVDGDVTADTVEVAGRVEGTVLARRRLRMAETGSIRGDALYESLEVERGGVIEGRASRVMDELVPSLPAQAAPPADPVSSLPIVGDPKDLGLISSIAFSEVEAVEAEGDAASGTTKPGSGPPPAPPMEARARKKRTDQTRDYRTPGPDLSTTQSSEESLH